MTEPDAARRRESVAVGAAVGEARRHRLERLLAHDVAVTPQDAGDAAHGSQAFTSVAGAGNAGVPGASAAASATGALASTFRITVMATRW